MLWPVHARKTKSSGPADSAAKTRSRSRSVQTRRRDDAPDGFGANRDYALYNYIIVYIAYSIESVRIHRTEITGVRRAYNRRDCRTLRPAHGLTVAAEPPRRMEFTRYTGWCIVGVTEMNVYVRQPRTYGEHDAPPDLTPTLRTRF